MAAVAPDNDPAVDNLREYLRIRSVHPNVNYDECIKYLQAQAKTLDLPCQVFEVLPQKPVLVMTWTGQDPAAKSILLNSHMDVVPVFEKSWKYPPFEARVVDGVIYGRGAVDMKTVAVQYLEAVRKLKADGVKLKRTVHLSFVPDEEIGGASGMGVFVNTDAFKSLNVGFALDEGMPNLGDEILVFNGERSIWHINIICPGMSGHGSLLLPDNCGEKLRYMVDKFMDLRQQATQQLADDPRLTVGDVTTVNLTMISGGIQNNVVPEKMTASFDIRLALSVNLEEFENMIRRWCTEAGSGVTYTFDQKGPYVPPTKLDDSNPYWLAIKAAAEKMKIPLSPRTFPGGTDSSFLRACALPALGMSPLRHTAPALHEHNESVRAHEFLQGILFYREVLPAIANVLKIPLSPRTFPGGTDSSYLRACALPALGISPLRHTAPALHEHNESVRAHEFLQGILFYREVLLAIANVLKIPLSPRTFPGGTDSRYLRACALPALGMSPLRHTAPALHQHNESVRAHEFLQGILFYREVLPAIANVL